MSKAIPLVELFGPTIQGEGKVIGQQTYFLRFGLCDYKCEMCDSMHAVNPLLVKQNAQWLNQEEIFQRYMRFRAPFGTTTPWVTYSGGNPCLHDLQELTDKIQEADGKIAVETQGTFCPEWVADCDIITVSPKPPGMGEQLETDKLDKFMGELNMHPGLNMKVVVFSQQDLEVAAALYDRYVSERKNLHGNNFFLSLGNPWPPGKEDPDIQSPGRLRDELIKRYKVLMLDIMQHPILNKVKFLPQWHVILFDNMKGV
jgi:7-carboxy-7-deazaguanine synthase